MSTKLYTILHSNVLTIKSRQIIVHFHNRNSLNNKNYNNNIENNNMTLKEVQKELIITKNYYIYFYIGLSHSINKCFKNFDIDLVCNNIMAIGS